VNVDVGDKVKRGQELVRLSSTLLQADVDSKRAMVKQREAELTNAEAELKRAQALSKQHVLSASDLDRLNSDAQAAKARLESARADLESSAVRLQFTHVTAPDDGVITSRTVTVGQISQVGAEMLRLLRQNRVEWRGEVPESRLAELHPGQKVTIKLAGGQTLDGVVRVVAPTISTSNRTGLVYADIDAHGYARPGMFASGEIEISHGSALTAPLASIVSSDGYNYLFVLRPDNTVERRKVKIGQVREANVEIISGVSAGELIVNKGAGFLKNGDLVNVAEAG
jgi:RND family efflux transporter MFP subunit